MKCAYPNSTQFFWHLCHLNKLGEGINGKVESRREALHLKPDGFYLSRRKMKYIECKFNKMHPKTGLEVKIENRSI